MIKNYPGSKGANGAWQQIISQVPRCTRFVECMAGSAVLSTRIRGIEHIIVNDIDPAITERLTDLPHHAKKLDLTTLDYRSVINKYAQDEVPTVFYLDPPYLMETRSHKKRLYTYEWDSQEHENFLSYITGCQGARFMISHYPCQLYNEALKDWRQVPYKSMTRAGLRQEVLYCNFDLPPLLADPSNVGENFTDRQRLKRKVNRLITRLDREEPLERSAILSYVIAHYDYLIS